MKPHKVLGSVFHTHFSADHVTFSKLDSRCGEERSAARSNTFERAMED